MFVNQKMRYLLISAGICLLMTGRALGQDIPKELYSAAGIPDSLKQDANSVVRYSQDEYRIKAPGKIVIKHHSLVTILNEKADRMAIVVLPYNRKFDTFSDIDIRAYDETGKLLKKYHRTDMYDGAANDDETLVSDSRFLGVRHSVAKYPETIEVSYEEDLNSYITMPSWYIQDGLEQSVQSSVIKVWVDSTAGFRYQSRNIRLTPQIASDGALITYTWQVKNLKGIKKEERAMSWREMAEVKFTTNQFVCFGNQGEISSWQKFGTWIYGLNSDITLSPARVEAIKKMTDTIKADKDKARFLYQYLQNNMRYVGIQLGIGGYKPFAASFVDEKKYGDCKALSNYMRALLNVVGVKAYCALIRAGENEEPASFSFPHNDFNHEILCIPFKNDTTWLECTSTKSPFGVLGPFTENRTALLITEDGGKLVNTPKSQAKDNQFNSEVHITLQPDGGAKANLKIATTGEYRLSYVWQEAKKLDEQKEYWLKDLEIKQPSEFDFDPGKDVNGVKQVNINLEYDRFCDVMAGDKQFYKPAAFALWHNVALATEKRVSDFYFDFPLEKSCVTTIELPSGYEVETLPANASLKFTYGTYDVNYVYDKNKNQVVSTAKFLLNTQMIPAAKYTEMQEYIDAVIKAENKKLVIHKKA